MVYGRSEVANLATVIITASGITPITITKIELAELTDTLYM